MGAHIEGGDLPYTVVEVLDSDKAAKRYGDEYDDVKRAVALTYGSDGDALVLSGNDADLIAFKDRVVRAVDDALNDTVTIKFMGKPFVVSKAAAENLTIDREPRETEESLSDVLGED